MLSTSPADLREVLLETYAINDGMNQLLLSYLDPRAWRAEPPGPKETGAPSPPSSLTCTTADVFG